MLNNRYSYKRQGKNRHLHGKLRPSYFALGFPTLEAMIEAAKEGVMSMGDLVKYCTEHKDCCGVQRITGGKYGM